MVKHCNATVILINRGELGIGGKLKCDDGTIISAGAVGFFPQDAQLNDRYDLLLSRYHILEAHKLASS